MNKDPFGSIDVAPVQGHSPRMLRVNGELVSPDLIEESFSRIKAAAEQRLQTSCCEMDPEFRAEAEQEVTDSILIAQEAEKLYPTIPEEELKVELKRMIDLYREHGASWEMLEQQRDHLRNEISATLRMEKLIDKVIGGDDVVTNEQAEQYYHEHQDDYTSPAESSCLHLVKSLREEASLIEQEETYQKMVKLREQALDGADFEELAHRETEKPHDEIDLGWFSMEQVTNPFETVLFSLREGEISPVIIYQNAFHLIKVTGCKAPYTQPLDEIREEIEKRALSERKRAALQVLANELRQDAKIERVESPEGE